MLAGFSFARFRNVVGITLAALLGLLAWNSYLQMQRSQTALHQALGVVQPMVLELGEARVQLVRAHQLVDRIIRRGPPRTRQVTDQLRSLARDAASVDAGVGTLTRAVLAAWFAYLDEESVSVTGDGALNAQRAAMQAVDELYRRLGEGVDDSAGAQLFVARLHGAVQSMQRHMDRDHLSASLPTSLLDRVLEQLQALTPSPYFSGAWEELDGMRGGIRRYRALFGHYLDEQRLGGDEQAMRELEGQLYSSWEQIELSQLDAHAALVRVLGTYRDAVLRDGQRSASVMFSILVFVALGIIAMFAVSGMLIARRTGVLVEATQRFADGDDGVRVDIPARDDFGCLAAGFNRMVSTISHQREDLEELAHQAEAASLSKSRFLSKVSHELRTPMNAVIGMAELLDSTDLDERQARYLARLREGGAAMMALVEDLLDVAQLETGVVEVRASAFVPGQLLQDIVQRTSHLVPAGVVLRTMVDAGVPPVVSADQRLVSRVLLHLVDNALKFTRSGEVVVGVRAGPEGEGVTRLQFSVADTGEGIAPEVLEGLFAAFEQADNSLTRTVNGVGVGLTVARGLLAKLGSHLDVKSTPGQGSVFSFDLECAPVDGGEPADAPPPAGLS